MSRAPRSIEIPPDLLPADGGFGCGPSRVAPGSLATLAEASDLIGTSHRQRPVKDLVGRVRASLAELFALPDRYEVVLGNGGAMAFWDAAVACLMRERSLHLEFGDFSSRFAQAAAAAPFLADPILLSAPPGEAPTPIADPRADAICWPHNETSTGAVVEVVRPAGCGDALVVIDGTSAAGGLPLDPSQLDVYYFAPQKCFGADGGLWLALLSPAAVARIEELDGAPSRWQPGFLSLAQALANSRLDQTYNTPAIATLILLATQLEWMLENGGLDWCVARSAESAAHLYGWAEESEFAWPFVDDRAKRSPLVGTIDFAEAVDAAALASTMRANGIVDLEPYRGLPGNRLRVGMFPTIHPDEVRALTACLDWLVPRIANGVSV